MKKIDAKKVTFLSSVFIGLIAHGFMLFNKFSWHDDIGIVTLGATVTSGRWGTQLFSDVYRVFIGDVTSMPFVEGMLFFVLAGCSSVFIGQLLKITSFIGCAALGGIMVVFPAVTSMFGYMFYMIWYAFGIFFAALAAYLFERIQNKILGLTAGVLCICLSLSMYQAFLPVTVSLMLMLMGNKILESRGENTKEIICKAAGCVAAVICGLILYICISKMYVRHYGQTLSDYQNINQMGHLHIDQLIAGAKSAYHDFFFLSDHIMDQLFMGSMRYVYYVILIFAFILIIRNLIYIYNTNRIQALLYLMIWCLFPLAVNLVCLYGAGIVYSNMKYAQVMVFIMLIYLCENALETLGSKEMKMITRRVWIGVFIVSLYFYARLSNKCYLKANLQQSETISWFNTLITQIKSTEGYDDEYRIAYINKGKIDDKTAYQETPVTDLMLTPYSNTNLYNNYAFIQYMKVWCGFYQLEVDDYAVFENDLRILQMPSYPDSGSIKVIDNVVVVKF